MTPHDAVTTSDWPTLADAQSAADIRRTITGSHHVVLSCTQGYFSTTIGMHRLLYRDRTPFYTTKTG